MADHCPQCGAFTEYCSKPVQALNPKTDNLVQFSLGAYRCNRCGWRYLFSYTEACERLGMTPLPSKPRAE